jgi:DNA-binding FrmR family transcriptional regulator
MVVPDNVQQELVTRLKRIEGQTRGVQRMVEEHRDCTEIIRQLASIRAATQSASLLLLRHYAKECSSRAPGSQSDDTRIEDLVDILLSAS